MAKGIQVPVRAGRSGGSEILVGSIQKAKILRLALAEGGDKNPFQDLGIKPRAVYRNEDALAGSDMKLEIRRILRKFVGKLEVNPAKPITIFRDPDRGFGVEFQWIDTETNELGDFGNFFQQPGVT